MNYDSEEEYQQAMNDQAYAEMEHNNDAAYAEHLANKDKQMSATSIFSLLETNKEQRQTFMSNLMTELDAGNVDPLKVHYQVKCIEKILDELTNTDEKKNKDGFNIAKRYKKLVLEAAEKYGQKEFDFQFSKIKIGEVGSKYDYSKCGDPVINELLEEEKGLKEAIKERTEFLQAIRKPTGVLIGDIENGEVVTIYPPAKSSTTSVIVTLK